MTFWFPPYPLIVEVGIERASFMSSTIYPTLPHTVALVAMGLDGLVSG